MKHPKTAGKDWNLEDLIYDAEGSGIAIALFERNNRTERSIGFRWLTKKTFFGKETEWILLPSVMSDDLIKSLIIKQQAGMQGVNTEALNKALEKLIIEEQILPEIDY